MKHNERYSKNDYNVLILKDYNIKQKLTLMSTIRRKGFEVNNNAELRGTVHDSKLDSSISRTRSKIFELAYCNNWKYFVTLTIDNTKYKRDDLKSYKKALSQFLRDYNKKYNIKIKYLLIPELHKDNQSWHMHGFIMGLPDSHLTVNSNGYLDWKAYRNKFGYISLGKIKNHEAVSKYCTKYITKDLAKSVNELNANMYYCSQGLNRAKEIKRGYLNPDATISWDYENDYVHVRWYSKNRPCDNFFQ